MPSQKRALGFRAAAATLAVLALAAAFLSPSRGQAQGVVLHAGGNFVAYGGPTLPVEEALNDALPSLSVVWSFDPATQRWTSWNPALPAALRALTELVNGAIYYVVATTETSWTYADPAPGLPVSRGIALVRGVNPVHYVGPTLPVEEALGEALADVSVIWLFDAAAQRWMAWNPALPAVLRELTALASGQIYLVVALTTSEWTFAEFPVSTAEADQIVVEQVVQPDTLDHDVLVFRHPEIVPPGARSDPGLVGGQETPASLIVPADSYLYWVDDAPGAKFGHDTRFVLVDSSTGAVTVSDQRSWPRLNGLDLFTEESAYWDAANWIFARLETVGPPQEDEEETADHLAPIARPLSNGEGSAVPPGECAVLVNGWSYLQPLERDMATDVRNMELLSPFSGWTHQEVVRPTRNRPAQFEEAVTRVAGRADCTDVTIYITAHGHPEQLSLGGEIYTSDQLAALLGRFPNVTFKVIVDACQSGALVDNLTALANVAIVITSTDSTRDSYGDVDRGDRNFQDRGSEYTSGFAEDLQELLADAGALEAIQIYADFFQVPFAVMLYHFAHISAVDKDAAASQGLTTPQRTTTFADPVTGDALPYPIGAVGTVQLVPVIVFQEHLIPQDQVSLAEADACGERHWHARSGTVQTLRGEVLADPNPTLCGFGTEAQVEVRQIPVRR